MKLPQWLKEHLLKHLVTVFLALFAFVSAKVWNDISVPFLEHVLPAVSNKTWLLISSILVLLVILLGAALIIVLRSHRELTISEKEKEIENRFDRFDKRLGIWTHKTESGYFCTKCKASHFESALRERPHGWKCVVCGAVYENPDYRPPKPPQPPQSRYRVQP
jgi:ribosomal protein L37AE/L43A